MGSSIFAVGLRRCVSRLFRIESNRTKEDDDGVRWCGLFDASSLRFLLDDGLYDYGTPYRVKGGRELLFVVVVVVVVVV